MPLQEQQQLQEGLRDVAEEGGGGTSDLGDFDRRVNRASSRERRVREEAMRKG